MKLHRLELEGFGPFLDTQVVDFDAFADDGIFLITGRTGAGKSSVLDGVCYALYGGVPRYDGAERRLRSDHCTPDDPTRVTLEFSAEGERWRVTRSPEFERPKRRGGGTTKEPHRALLEVRTTEGWEGVAARPVDVGTRLDEILGLSQQQFLQVILLAQNRFARFLLAKNDERLSLLRTLFGTRSFEDYAAQLDEKRKRAQERLAAEGVEVSTLLDEAERLAAELDADLETDVAASDGAAATEPVASETASEDATVIGDAAAQPPPAPRSVGERLAHVVRAVERAEYRVDTRERERGAADEVLDGALAAEREARTLRDRQLDRLRVREQLATLEAEAERVAAARAEAAAAGEAEALRAAIDADKRTAADLAASEDRLATAVGRVEAAGEDPTDDLDALRRRDDELTGLLARGEAALAAESALAEADADGARAASRISGLEAERDTLAEGRADVPGLLKTLDERLAELAGATAQREAAASRCAETRSRLDAAREAERLLAHREQADTAALVRGEDMRNATDAWTALLRRRLAGAAAELAHELVDGEPCAVCGSREHPNPATGDDAPVTDEQLAAAEVRKNTAIEQDRLASDAARIARDDYALAAARAGGESVEALSSRLEEAEQALSAARDDEAEYARVQTERTRAADLDAAIAARLETLTVDLANARQEAALAMQRADSLRDDVEAARGAFPTVVARQADLTARRTAVRALTTVRAEVATAAAAHREAAEALRRLVAESPFDTVDAVMAALRPAPERRRLDETIAAHDAAVASARQRLLDLEMLLVDAADGPVDITPLSAAVAAARENVQRSAAAHASALALADRLRGLAHRADAGHAAVATLADEHAVVARLADTLAGRAPNTRRMTLETFVLAAELEEIVVAANLRLEQMSSGRYRLQHTDALAARGAASGLGLEVMDAFTGQCRPPQSLSGGETFLTSLSLALGLAEVVTARAGGIRLDTLFIDEGFGSLDDETLDLAMRTLDELRQGGRTVGVISHVASMKDQLPAQLRVVATPRGPSVITQDSALQIA
ncbi:MULTISPECIES: SMC family ATPase [Microbacterium]|uniref:AAA family ATPase n=1 Tax=Microbacterium TaxID=33882 RepID=UPI002782CD40|nr:MULTISPECIES: SMC family ATPase [Microbacterium]MDQ1075749.1 exonuclease SbcC [Microbacterium sp. SORGH_AS_0969]MDQ1115992.1 exonuclease SbcC [Microbacterium testaceum]